MLILSRRIDEALKIGDDVTVTVLSIKGKQVRLGIDAPDEVSIHREEIYHQIKTGEKAKKETSDSEPTHQTGDEST